MLEAQFPMAGHRAQIFMAVPQAHCAGAPRGLDLDFANRRFQGLGRTGVEGKISGRRYC